VRIGGKDIYLGRYGSREARAAYARLLGEIETAGQEAVKAARQWRFVPGTRLGEPVAVRITIELTFTLR